MAEVLKTLKRFYTEDGAMLKHVVWLVLSFICVILQMPSESGNTSVLSVIFGLVLTIYTFGYNSIIMHNRFEEEGKSRHINIMPEFDQLPFKIFGRAFILVIVWFIYSLLFLLIPILGWIVAPFVIFVQVAYSKEFKTEGLYNAALIVKFLRLFWVPAILFWFRLFLCGLVFIGVLALIGFLSGAFDIMSIMMSGQIPPLLIAIIVLIQYFSTVLGFVSAYGLTDIYLKKWDDSSY